MPDLAQITKGMRSLLKKDTAYVWSPEISEEFDKARELLSSPMLVHPFDPQLETHLLTDASRLHGLGYMLIQYNNTYDTAKLRPRIIQCGSFSTTSTQQNYAVIELECLAIVRAVQKCDYYLRGMDNFHVITDHKPLIGVLTKNITEISNSRILKYREILASFSFTVTWNAGKDHLIADALSRAPIFPSIDDTFCNRIIIDPALDSLLKAAKTDEKYNTLVEAFVAKKGVDQVSPSHEARKYKNIWSELSILETNDSASRLLTWGDRIIIPASARAGILERLHIPHQGVIKTLLQAKRLYYWPGMANEIKQVIQACFACQKFKPSQQREQLQTYP